MAAALSIQQKPNLETYSLIWLDSSLNNSQESIQAQQHLRTAINSVKLFKQANECETYIRSLAEDERIILIVSGRLGQEIVPRIHQCRQVSAIYVYCMNKQQNEQWARKFNKIKHIIVNLSELVNKIRDDQNERQRNKVIQPLSFSICQLHPADKELSQSFTYSHLLIRCLLQTNSTLTDKNDLLSLCKTPYQGNESELKVIEEFEQNYFPSQALSWYTRQSFLYRLLNKALQSQNLEVLLLFRFFLRDIERQLEKRKCPSPVHVYCGQIMSSEEVQRLKTNTGGCLLFHSFLSTTTKQQIEMFFSQNESSNEFQRVLFDIEADPRLENIKPFSNIKSQSSLPNEEQTLFMLGSIFRLINIRQEHNEMWVVQMKLCSENDPDFKSILQEKQADDALSFGQRFCKLKRFDDAEIYYQHLLKSLPSEHEEMVLVYDALGNLAKEKGDYDVSLQYFNKSLEMRMKILEIDHPDIGDNYNNIGEIYEKKKDFKRAMDSFNKALTILKKKLNDDDPKIAICLNNMGHVYKNDKKYPKALECYQQAFHIRQKHFPSDHLQLADSYKHLGTLYEYLGDFDRALDNYKRSLDIYENDLSHPHLVIATIQKSIGGIYEKKKQLPLARSYYEKALTDFRKELSPTDPHIIQIQQDIQRVSVKVK